MYSSFLCRGMSQDLEGEISMVAHSASDKQALASRRTARRCRVSGIVVLTNSGKPVVMRIYDIAKYGVSFLHARDWSAPDVEIKMDILIFDVKSNSEHLIPQVKGRIQSTDLIADPDRKGQIWRTRVTFHGYNLLQQDDLYTFLELMSESGTEKRDHDSDQPEEDFGTRYVTSEDNRSLVFQEILSEENPDKNAESNKGRQGKKHTDWKMLLDDD